MFRKVEPGGGYRVRKGTGGAELAEVPRADGPRASRPNTDDLQPDDRVGGYGYLKTRDGTKLAINDLPARARRTPAPTRR